MRLILSLLTLCFVAYSLSSCASMSESSDILVPARAAPASVPVTDSQKALEGKFFFYRSDLPQVNSEASFQALRKFQVTKVNQAPAGFGPGPYVQMLDPLGNPYGTTVANSVLIGTDFGFFQSQFVEADLVTLKSKNSSQMTLTGESQGISMTISPFESPAGTNKYIDLQVKVLNPTGKPLLVNNDVDAGSLTIGTQQYPLRMNQMGEGTWSLIGGFYGTIRATAVEGSSAGLLVGLTMIRSAHESGKDLPITVQANMTLGGVPLVLNPIFLDSKVTYADVGSQ